MKKLVLLLFYLIMIPFVLKANEDIKAKIKADLIKGMEIGNYQMGKKYIVAIPPNETASFGWSDSAMEIYVAGAYDTNLDLTILGIKKTEKLRAGEVIVINDELGLTKTAAEIREPNLATDKTVIIEADKPVSVYVMNSKSTTSDGYMAIPVEHWGREYLHCSYYDNYESSTNKYAGGFLVLAAENETTVDVDIRGFGKDAAFLKGTDKTIGDSFSFTVDEGQVYQVEADGLTRGEFDITGTKISATKPIGIVSYHWRAVIPIFTSSSRDHLCEMIPPTKTLGKEYASICLERNGSKKGDLFRLVATEANTSYDIKWYDIETKELLGERDGVLENAGDFREYSPTMSSSATVVSITGTSVFKADKPILLMQYSYSGGWDGSSYDPFMWVVTSLEQYASHALVQAPSNKTFAENYISIIAIHDTNDTEKIGLKSIEFDGTKLTDKIPSFTNNKIPGTDLYWARFKIHPGPQEMKSNGTKFGGYIYGFKSVDSYGWPAVMGFKPLDRIDTMPPLLTITRVQGSASKWNIRVQEDRYLDSGEVKNVDSKVWFKPITLINDQYGLSSYNFKEPTIDFEWKYEGHDDYMVTLEVEDPEKEALATFYVADYEGNISLESISYTPHVIVLNNIEDTNFENALIDSSQTQILQFSNPSDEAFTIDSIYITNNNNFSVASDSYPSIVQSGSFFSLEVQYSPKVIAKEYAVLNIKTSEYTFSWELSGSSYTDKETLVFADGDILDFESVAINHTHNKNIVLQNAGTTDIDINTLNLKNGTLYKVDQTQSGKTIEPGKSTQIIISYHPVEESEADRDTLIIETTNTLYIYPIVGKADKDISVEEEMKNIINISPNPIQSDANITINIPVAANLKANLYSSEGQFVKSLYNGMCNKGEKSLEFNSSGIASGTYTLIIEFGNRKFASQIVIAK